MSKNILLPIGVLAYVYPDCPDCMIQYVPYKDMSDLMGNLEISLKSGFDISNVHAYAWDRADAEKLFEIIDRLSDLSNVRGERLSVFALTDDNVWRFI